MADLHRTSGRSIRIGRGAACAMVGIFLSATLTWCAGTAAAAGADLYRAKVTVTGQGEANRIVGFAACLEDVLIKVSGALKLSGDPRLAAYKSKAKDFVTGYSYRDQFFGKPIRDEQGTRDRPYDLTVEFEESKIDDILGAVRPQALAFTSSAPCRLCRDGARREELYRDGGWSPVRPAT